MCVNDLINTYDRRTSLDSQQLKHRLKICRSKTTVGGCNFCNKPPTCIEKI